MSDKKTVIILFFIVFLVTTIYLAYKLLKNKKNEEIEENYKKHQQEKNRIRERKEYSIKWNNEIQKKFNSKVKYKTSRPVKALIGDYTKSMAPLTNSLLRSMGIETEVVPTASDIIDRIEGDNRYDVIITNNVYPHGESGEMVLDILKEKNYNIPIIILTVDQNARNIYLGRGFDEYIDKPIDEKKAIESLTKVIKGLKFIKIQNNNKI